MLTDLEAGDVAETISKFFETSKHMQPAHKSVAVSYFQSTKYGNQ